MALTSASDSLDAVCFQFPSSYFEINDNPVPYIINAVFVAPLAIITTAANALVLRAIWKTPSLHLPSKMLLFNLALTDLTTGLATLPSFVVFLVSKVVDSPSHIRCLSALCFAIALSAVTCISLITITAISLDRFAAFHCRSKYHEMVTAGRVRIFLAACWLYTIVYASSWLWSMTWYSQLALATYCTSFLVTSLAYISIHRGLLHHTRVQAPEFELSAGHSVQNQVGSAEFNVAQYRRSTVNMLWIYGLFILCYLPDVCLIAVRRFVGPTVLVQCILEFTVTIAFLNSCLNPILYCYRLPEIRSSVVEMLRKVCLKSQTVESG